MTASDASEKMRDASAGAWSRVLAVDTSTMVQSVAVLDGPQVLGERVLKTRAGHSAGLLAAIDGLLREVRWELERVELLAVGVGPGSFTGLRIGLASLKAMAFARELPLWPVSSLKTIARGVGPVEGLVVPVVDARRGEVYAGAYRRDAEASGGVGEALSDRAIAPGALGALVAEQARAGEPVRLVGSGLRRYGAALVEGLEAQGGLRVETLDATFAAPRASHLGWIAREEARPELLPALAMLEPNYQRASEAEINAEKKARAAEKSAK